MVSQVVNQRSLNKYDDFVAALGAVLAAIEETDKLIGRMTETVPRFNGWKVPNKKEVMGARNRVTRQLDVLRAAAKNYEKELVSRQWRV